MHDYSLTPLKLGLFNLKRNSFRTVALIFLIATVAFTLLSGSFLLYSMKSGINNLSARMGADLMVVPYGYEKNMQNVLLRGEPSSFYLETNILDKIKTVNGVSQASPQLYLATLTAGCCAYPLQMIGYDPQTDFVIQPWINKTAKKELGSGEIVIGANITASPGDTLMFFSQNFKVISKLAKTGMGFDNSVFMTLSTTNNLVATAPIFQKHPLTEQGEKYSSIVVKTTEGENVKDIANDILQKYAREGIIVVTAQKMISDISSSMRGLIAYVAILATVLWLLTIIVLTIVFAVTIKARQKELAIFRVLGARHSFLRKMLLWEATWLSTSGAFIGIIIALIVIWPFSAYISAELSLPYLEPNIIDIMGISLACFLMTFILGPLASIYSIRKLNQTEITQSIKEDL